MSCEEELTNCTLNTLKSLAHGYNTGKLLSQSASIKDMLLQHLVYIYIYIYIRMYVCMYVENGESHRECNPPTEDRVQNI